MSCRPPGRSARRSAGTPRPTPSTGGRPATGAHLERPYVNGHGVVARPHPREDEICVARDVSGGRSTCRPRAAAPAPAGTRPPDGLGGAIRTSRGALIFRIPVLERHEFGRLFESISPRALEDLTGWCRRRRLVSGYPSSGSTSASPWTIVTNTQGPSSVGRGTSARRAGNGNRSPDRRLHR
jgi:hypothetical protein